MKNFRPPYLFRWIFHRRVWGFSLREPKVYLTFDDGPTTEGTEWILATLREHDAKATFFCVGENARRHPDLMQKMIEEGHTVGNHTMRHEKGIKTEKDVYLRSVEEAKEWIPSKLFRPPYGRVPMAFARSLRKEYSVVMWTWLSYDYDATVPVERILKEAERIRPGDILVLHDNVKTFARLQEVLPPLLEILKKKQLEVVAISA